MTILDYRELIQALEDLIGEYCDNPPSVRAAAMAAAEALQEEGEVDSYNE